MSKLNLAESEASQTGYSEAIVLDTPILRGNTSITEIKVRRPNAGELRGVSLIDLGNMNVIAVKWSAKLHQFS